MNKKHLSTQFNTDLDSITNNLMKLAGLAEAQISSAKLALQKLDVELAKQILNNEITVNDLEKQVQILLSEIIVRRQPTARDLRFLLSAFRIAIDLERIGDEAKKVARKVIIFSNQPLIDKLPYKNACITLQLAIDQIKKVLDALARLDKDSAKEVLINDQLINDNYNEFIASLNIHLQNSPQAMSLGLDLAIMAKGIERMGDHAKNIAQSVIYIIDGSEVL